LSLNFFQSGTKSLSKYHFPLIYYRQQIEILFKGELSMSSKPVVRKRTSAELSENRRWLKEQINPYFFTAMRDEPEALALLEHGLGSLRINRRLILADRDKSLILARVNAPGSLYDSLRHFQDREISYAMITHSEGPMPGMEQALEIQRFEFDRKKNEDILAWREVELPKALARSVAAELRRSYPEFDMKEFYRLLRILWLNNENYVRVSSPLRVAQVLQLQQKASRSGGLYLYLEQTTDPKVSRVHFAVGNPPQKEFLLQLMEVFNRLEIGVNRAYCLTPKVSRVHFAVGNPPQKEFLLQLMEVFNRLEIGVNRAYCLTISNGVHPYFLGTFLVSRRSGDVLETGSELFCRLQQEFYNTQIVSTKGYTYREFVTTGVMTGEEASLTNAFVAFCHTNLAHNQPDRFGLDDVQSAFHSHPEMSLQLVKLFRARFDPAITASHPLYGSVLEETVQAVDGYNTGHRYLDEVRRTIYRCCLIFITHTLKTNFFVLEKQALAFRLDPAYLAELGVTATSDLPPAVPFRVTFFFSRFGFGYHIGFSDIARGGWRTVIARNMDDFITNSNTIFRENFVLAHTQHLKNKDIYEGGSKLVLILDASDLRRGGEREMENWRLYKLQHGVTNSFLDIFVTENGVARNPVVVDYYREDEPIELGPDENMHDSMIENIARISKRRGYILGIGIMSSKEVGINHKEYGVTSTGVVKFAEITMAELGIDIYHEPFSVKFTGGPNGDVAGNAMRILLSRAPQVAIKLILDGTAALCDPEGADRKELSRIVLKEDLEAFDPHKLHAGGFMLFRGGSRRDGLRELFRKVTRTVDGMREEWISTDEFSRVYGHAVQRGYRGGGQLVHHARGARPAAEEGGHHHARRLRQQVRRDLLLLRDHRQPAPWRGGVPGGEGALREGRAGDPGTAGGGRGEADTEEAPRAAGRSLHRDLRRALRRDKRAVRDHLPLLPEPAAPLPAAHLPESDPRPSPPHAEGGAEVRQADQEPPPQVPLRHTGGGDRLLACLPRRQGGGLRDDAQGAFDAEVHVEITAFFLLAHPCSLCI